MRFLIVILSVLMLSGIAGASTVTLTGTCYTGIINKTSNYIQFNITNSGNGTATDLLIEPLIAGASTTNTSMLLPLVAPGGMYGEKIYLSNFSVPGSYVERFITRYSQGTSQFVTIFPCIANIGQQAPSLLAIAASQKGSGTIAVNVSNIANYSIDSQVSVYAPPEFTVSPQQKNVTVAQYGVTDVSFSYTAPKYTDAEFPMAVAASYVKNGVHYASLSVIVVKFGSGGTSSAPDDWMVFAAAAAAVLIIMMLIVYSVIANRHKKNPDESKNRRESETGK
jgi:hypothetical protein